MGRHPEKSLIAAAGNRQGSALIVVLWALVALSALALSASVGGLVDLRLATRHREHAIALNAAESGIAEALAALHRDPSRTEVPDSVAGAGPAGSWAARWTPVGERLHLRSRGSEGSAERELEAWAEPGATGWLVVAWREVR